MIYVAYHHMSSFGRLVLTMGLRSETLYLETPLSFSERYVASSVGRLNLHKHRGARQIFDFPYVRRS